MTLTLGVTTGVDSGVGAQTHAKYPLDRQGIIPSFLQGKNPLEPNDLLFLEHELKARPAWRGGQRGRLVLESRHRQVLMEQFSAKLPTMMVVSHATSLPEIALKKKEAQSNVLQSF